MTLASRWNRLRYRLYGPVYDELARPLEPGRQRAIERLDPQPGEDILIVGAGTGLDMEYLPAGVTTTTIDLIPAMVRRTEARADSLGIEIDARVGDARSLSFEDGTFDAVLLHLVLSVIPDPDDVVAETERVLDTDGRVSIYDKFVSEGSEPSLLRRAANPAARFLFADLNRRLEPMIDGTALGIGQRETFLGGLYIVTIARPTANE